LYLISRNSDDPNIKSFYKAYCKSLACDILKTKRSYCDKLISNSNDRIKSSRSIVKVLTGRKSPCNTLPTSNNYDQVSINSKNIPESFNNYFLSVPDLIINKISNTRNPSDKITTLNQCLFDVFNGTFPKIRYNFVTTNDIVYIINKLKMTNSFGYDKIPVKILQSSSYYISSPLTYIINRSLATGIFPDRLKFSEIIPIYKKGDKNLISNSRPISILTSFSKIFEKVIYMRLYNCLVSNNNIANEQFGFKANSSTDNAMHKLLDQIQMALNDGQKWEEFSEISKKLLIVSTTRYCYLN
jgi:Notch-like protein